MDVQVGLRFRRNSDMSCKNLAIVNRKLHSFRVYTRSRFLEGIEYFIFGIFSENFE